MIRSIRSVLAGQYSTDYISTFAPALLLLPARYGTLTVISKATVNHVLYVVLVIDARPCVLIGLPDSLDDSDMFYLGYSAVLRLVSSMGCL